MLWWILLLAIWLLHFLGVLVPETGFDAVWYHLPLAKAIAEHGGLVYLPSLYQSLNPQLGEIWFALGWKVAGEFGVKVVAFGWAVGLIGVTALLARRWLRGGWLVVTLILVSLMQVVSWQASSAYVDIQKAVWELLALWAIYRYQDSNRTRWLYLAGLALGASMATKLFSLLLWPLWLGWWWYFGPKHWVVFLKVQLMTLVLPCLFYWWAFTHTGNPWFNLFFIVGQNQTGLTSSLWQYGWQQASSLWKSPLAFLLARDYVNWLVILTGPWLLTMKRNFYDRATVQLVIFSAFQWLVWWFLPPLSTRYAVAGFVGLIILTMRILQVQSQKSPAWHWAIVMTIGLSVVFHLAPRLMVARRQWPVLTGQQTRTEYLHQFLDGNIDQHLKSWHGFQ